MQIDAPAVAPRRGCQRASTSRNGVRMRDARENRTAQRDAYLAYLQPMTSVGDQLYPQKSALKIVISFSARSIVRPHCTAHAGSSHRMLVRNIKYGRKYVQRLQWRFDFSHTAAFLAAVLLAPVQAE
jgi:hypothetical protein